MGNWARESEFENDGVLELELVGAQALELEFEGDGELELGPECLSRSQNCSLDI